MTHLTCQLATSTIANRDGMRALDHKDAATWHRITLGLGMIWTGSASLGRQPSRSLFEDGKGVTRSVRELLVFDQGCRHQLDKVLPSQFACWIVG